MNRKQFNSSNSGGNRQAFQLACLPLARRTLALLLASGIMTSSSGLSSFAQMLDTSKPVRGQIAITRDVNIATKNDKISLNLRDTPIRDLLNMLAQQGNFNLILDESVAGNLTVDIKNIPINKALEYIFTIGDLSYTKDGNTVIVASSAKTEEKNLNTKTFKSIPVQYKGAQTLVDALNNTIFKVGRPNGSAKAIVAADTDSNSLLVMGTDADIKLVGDALRELDVPRNRKVYQIKHSDPARVMGLLSSNFFQNTGISTTGGSGSSGGPTGTAAGAAGNTSTTTFNGGGVSMIADPVSSTLTAMATDEQLALIDSVIDELDTRRPQVVIELSLVEVQNADLKTFVPHWDKLHVGKDGIASMNGLDANGNSTGINQFFLTRLGVTPYPKNLSFRTLEIDQSNKNTRAKVLANPNIVAMDGTASTINITDQVPSVSQAVVTANGVTTITNTITTQSAGVTMNITPRIFNDGYVELNMAPTVSQPIATFRAGAASTVLISTRTLTLAGVRVKDGQTLVIGGMLKEHSSLDVDKVPGLGNLPIVRAMVNATNGDTKDRTELVLMVTPHILKEEGITYFTNPAGNKYNNPNQGGIQPVSLPRFIGSMSNSSAAEAFKQMKGDVTGPIQDAAASSKEVPKSAPKDTGKVEQPAVNTQEPAKSGMIPIHNEGPKAATQPKKPTADKIEMEVQPNTDLKKSMLPAPDDTMSLRPRMSETTGTDALKVSAKSPGRLFGRNKQTASKPNLMDEILK